MIHLSDKAKNRILVAAAIPSYLVIVFRQAIGRPAKQWLHDVPNFAVGLIACIEPEPGQDDWLTQLRDQALTELNFRRSFGIVK